MKQKNMKLNFCKADLLAIALVAVLALLIGIWFWSKVSTVPGSTVVVYQNGERIRELPLNQDTEYVVEGAYQNVICVREGKAAIIKSDCPGTDCVHSGWIRDAGRSIVCLPNRVELRIEGNSEVDFVVR